jgi:RND family efflux transporter MFP subunit
MRMAFLCMSEESLKTNGQKISCSSFAFSILVGCFFSPSIAQASSYDCLIEPMQTVELASPVTGLLDKVYVKRGEYITKGQVLASLESRAEQAAADLARFKSEQVGPLHTAENKIEFAKRKFSRRQNMAAQKLLSQQESDDAEAELRQAESELQVAKENIESAKIEYRQQSSQLNLRTIHSPFNGVVVDQMLFPGEIVEPGGTKKGILKVAQLDPLQVHVILPKEAFGKVKPGMPVEVTSEISSKTKYSAKVKMIDRMVNPASGTFVVFLDLHNPKFEIAAGMKCRADFAGIESGNARPAVAGKN